ncbi:integrase, partial [Salmonella enterica subsp. enterica serovar Oranienburg]|nr:integrase [Salmonella enterica subsp. enterica serovar Oranienburg]
MHRLLMSMPLPALIDRCRLVSRTDFMSS